MSSEPVRTAFQRFVDALNDPHDRAVLAAAVADDVRLARHRPGERGGAPVVETFTQITEVAGWLSRMPAGIRFELAGAAWTEPDGRWGVEYAYHAGDFHHGGLWLARLADDGRIAQLAHHPFALREEK